MARIRTIKPTFWKHEVLSALPEATHMLAAALLNYADDEGYFNANIGLIKGECFPLREPSVTIPESLTHLSAVGYVRLGTAPDGRRYGHIVTFADHQVVNKKTQSKIKALGILWEPSVTATVPVPEPSHPEGNKEGKGIRNKDRGQNSSPKTNRGTRLPDHWPLTPDLIREAIAAGLDPNQLHTEHAKFCDYWRAKPGKDAAKLDWVGTWRNWCRNSHQFGHAKPAYVNGKPNGGAPPRKLTPVNADTPRHELRYPDKPWYDDDNVPDYAEMDRLGLRPKPPPTTPSIDDPGEF